MTTKIFFDDISDAINFSLNIGEPINEDLSIEVDPEELEIALRQTNISSSDYSVAVISEPE